MAIITITVAGRNERYDAVGTDDRGRRWRHDECLWMRKDQFSCRECGTVRNGYWSTGWVADDDPSVVLCSRCAALKDRWKGFGYSFHLWVRPASPADEDRFVTTWRAHRLGATPGKVWLEGDLLRVGRALQQMETAGLIQEIGFAAEPRITFRSKRGRVGVFALLALLAMGRNFEELVAELFDEEPPH
jgi:hypothetical protein